MKVSLSWLNDYVEITMAAPELAEALTMAGLEVESVTDRFAYLKRVLVGRIVGVHPHPNADMLQLCEVDIGDRVVPVVCGAPNAQPGVLAPLALPGAIFPNGSVLEKSLIRGVSSEGMLCSAAEIGLGPDRSGILSIEEKVRVGESIDTALSRSDMVFEIGLTPNRPDCLSIIGVAREVAAIQGTKLNCPQVALDESGNRILSLAAVSIEAPTHCPRYAARLLEGVAVSDSPFWLQDRLLSVGFRPINNVVDVTNFVMMETGQPLHAFDFDRLADQRIVVRTAREGEVFFTLDGKERQLSSEMLMICDGQRPVAIGGVMGGRNSEIDKTTRRVLIESAYFSPVSIRKTSRQLGLNTDASHRFERGVDPEGTLDALNRAAQIMRDVSGGDLARGVIDEHPNPTRRGPLRLSVKATNRFLGVQLDRDTLKKLLGSIEFSVQNPNPDRGAQDSGDLLDVTAPSFRVDISRPEDLMEEVARLWGYHNIPTTFPLIPAGKRQPLDRIRSRDKVKDLMAGFGFTEAINYSFINKASCDRLGLAADDPRRRVVEILNPISEDQTVMRTSLVPGLLETLHRNMAQQTRTLKLFEVGKIFIASSPHELPEEKDMLAGLWTGVRYDSSWHFQETGCDFYDLKGVVEGLLKGLKVEHPVFTRMNPDACLYTRPGVAAEIAAEGEVIGLIGEIHPKTRIDFDLKQPVFLFEIDLNRLFNAMRALVQFRPIPKFPAVSRDITLIVDRDVESIRVVECIRKMEEALVEDIALFDVFEGGPIPEGKKSLSLRIVYRSMNETLQDERVSQIHQAIAKRLLAAFHAALPA